MESVVLRCTTTKLHVRSCCFDQPSVPRSTGHSASICARFGFKNEASYQAFLYADVCLVLHKYDHPVLRVLGDQFVDPQHLVYGIKLIVMYYILDLPPAVAIAIRRQKYRIEHV